MSVSQPSPPACRPAPKFFLTHPDPAAVSLLDPRVSVAMAIRALCSWSDRVKSTRMDRAAGGVITTLYRERELFGREELGLLMRWLWEATRSINLVEYKLVGSHKHLNLPLSAGVASTARATWMQRRALQRIEDNLCGIGWLGMAQHNRNQPHTRWLRQEPVSVTHYEHRGWPLMGGEAGLRWLVAATDRQAGLNLRCADMAAHLFAATTITGKWTLSIKLTDLNRYLGRADKKTTLAILNDLAADPTGGRFIALDRRVESRDGGPECHWLTIHLLPQLSGDWSEADAIVAALSPTSWSAASPTPARSIPTTGAGSGLVSPGGELLPVSDTLTFEEMFNAAIEMLFEQVKAMKVSKGQTPDPFNASQIGAYRGAVDLMVSEHGEEVARRALRATINRSPKKPGFPRLGARDESIGGEVYTGWDLTSRFIPFFTARCREISGSLPPAPDFTRESDLTLSARVEPAPCL